MDTQALQEEWLKIRLEINSLSSQRDVILQNVRSLSEDFSELNKQIVDSENRSKEMLASSLETCDSYKDFQDEIKALVELGQSVCSSSKVLLVSMSKDIAEADHSLEERLLEEGNLREHILDERASIARATDDLNIYRKRMEQRFSEAEIDEQIVV